MKKIKYYYNKNVHEFLMMPKIIQFTLIVLLIVFIYQMVSLYFIQIDLNKVREEIEQLK